METVRTKKFGAVKFGFAALAAAALTVTGFSPAYAADYQLGPADIAGFENGDEELIGDGYNYDQWHVGNVHHDDDFPGADQTTVDQSLKFDTCSVEFLEPVYRDVTQLMKGFPIDARPSTPADIRAAIESTSASFTADSGSVTLQFPFFEFRSDAETGDPLPDFDPNWFGTVRNAEGFTDGTAVISSETELMGSEGGAGTLDVLIAFMEDEIEAGAAEGVEVRYELLGIGMTGSAGTEVQTLGFLGDTYYFGTGDCLPEAPAGETPEGETETPAQQLPAPKKPVAVETGIER